MNTIKNERGFTLVYTLFIILFLTFVITYSFNQNLHLQMIAKNDHNMARVEYYVLLSIDNLQQLYQLDDQLDAGIFTISNVDVQFQRYKENLTEIIWRLSFTLDEKNKTILLTMSRDRLEIVSWVQTE